MAERIPYRDEWSVVGGNRFRRLTPQRIQRQRTKGWRMPEGAVYVGRPTRWGNQWKVGDRWFDALSEWSVYDVRSWIVLTTPTLIAAYRADLGLMTADETAEWIAPLRGRDLACWCPLDQPCHADVLLQLANR